MTTLEKLECIGKIFSISTGIATTIGVLIIYYYCRTIGFLPTKMDIGDGLIFILTSISFGWQVLVFIALISFTGQSAYYLTYRIVRLLRPTLTLPTPTSGKDIFLSHLVMLIIIVGMIYIALTKEHLNFDDYFFAVKVFVILSLNGFILTTMFSGTSSSFFIKFLFPLSLIITSPFLIIPKMTDSMINASISNVGISKKNISIILEKAVSDDIILLAKNHNCDLKNETLNQKVLLKNIDILFTGYGDSSKIRINTSNKICMEISVPSTSIMVVDKI